MSVFKRETWQRMREYLLVIAMTLILTFPLYINAYRVSVADLVPLDDYREMVISLEQGTLAGFTAPFGYRILTPLLAVPFMQLTPPAFTRTPENHSSAWISATFGLCTVSYGFLVLTTAALYGYLRSLRIPIPGILLTLMIFWFSPARELYLYPMTDAGALFGIVLLLWAYERQRWREFLCGSFLAIMTKETTILVMAGALIIQGLWRQERRERALRYSALLLPSILLYLTATMIWHFPGNEQQLHVWEYPARFAKLPSILLNIRGIFLNLYPLWPIVFALFLLVLARRKLRRDKSLSFYGFYSFVTLGLMALGAALDVQYNIGRIAFLSFPLFTPVLGSVLSAVLSELHTVTHDN